MPFLAFTILPWIVLLLLSIISGHGAAFTSLPFNSKGGCTPQPSISPNTHVTIAAESVAVAKDISVTVPSNWNGNENDWPKEAADILRKHGVVTLTSSDNEKGLLHRKLCDDANRAAVTRVAELHRRIESRGIDPSGADQPYRFAEVICRDDGGRRFDVPVPWFGCGESGRENIGMPLDSNERRAFESLHRSTEKIVQPVVNELWSDADENDENRDTSASYHATAAGFLMNEPGSSSQNWHRDGPDAGYIDCFVPLIDLNESIGPTAILPCTHASSSSVDELVDKSDGRRIPVVPMLKKGDILLFDYRTIHRGLANVSESTTRTLAYVVFKRNDERCLEDLGDIHNFPAALTLEYD